MFLLTPDTFSWDLAIALLMAFGLAIAILCGMRLTQKSLLRPAQRFIIGFFGFLGFFGSLLTMYGSFIEPQILVTDTMALTLPVHQHLRIAVVSDLHVGAVRGQGIRAARGGSHQQRHA